MRLLRLIGYFSQLRALIGFTASCTFAVTHAWNRIHPSQGGGLANVLVGPYTFYFPSLQYFEGLFTEIFLKGTYYIMPTREPIRVIDCGSNIGVSLLYTKTRAPYAQVLCFEPNPAARAVLEKNIKANNWEKEVQVLPYALGKEKGVTTFFIDDTVATSSGGSVARYIKNKNHVLDSYTVEVDTLSHYIDGPIDFLKVDIEGSEFDVLEELSRQKKFQQIATIQLEYHYIPKFFTRPLSEMLFLLESQGFRTFVQSNVLAPQVVNQNDLHTYMIFAWRA